MNMRKKICIINNDPFIGKLLKDYLVRYPCKIDKTSSSDTALKLISSNNYTMVFVDYSLSSMNGADLMHEMKKRNKNTIFIGMSASGRDKESFDRVGADYFLQKPINFKFLESILKRFF